MYKRLRTWDVKVGGEREIWQVGEPQGVCVQAVISWPVLLL